MTLFKLIHTPLIKNYSKYEKWPLPPGDNISVLSSYFILGVTIFLFIPCTRQSEDIPQYVLNSWNIWVISKLKVFKTVSKENPPQNQSAQELKGPAWCFAHTLV